jgi:PadR family transcriptional regulator, regulatory protein AphA
VNESKRDIRLTPTSHVVLGMLDWLGPSTPYRLKQVLTDSVEDFFPVPHTSFYAEPARLAGAGYVTERREEGGRRRKTYELTNRGREALRSWLVRPEADYGQFRFPAILKTFFGADPRDFALDQAEHHRELAEKFEAVQDRVERGEVIGTPNQRLVLETGIRVHRWWEQTWREIDSTAGGRTDGEG